MWNNIKTVFRGTPKAAIFVIVIAIIGLITAGEVTDVGFVFSLFGEMDRTAGGLLLSLAVFVPAVVYVAAWIFTGDIDRSDVWLNYLSITFGIALVVLVGKELVYDVFLTGYLPTSNFENGLKELFGFVITLYAFVAGFLLLFSLQEFSSVSKEFKAEIDSWHGISDLMRFFYVDTGKKRLKDATPSEKENDEAAKTCVEHILTLKESEQKPELGPPQILKKVYGSILRLEVNDDNDKEALNALIQQYCKLRMYLRQREDRRIKAPSMLVIQLWLVASLTIMLASLGVLNLLPEYFIKTPLGELTFVIGVTIIVMPITLINMTIADLRNPFTGEWSIKVVDEYEKLVKSLKLAREEDLDQ